MKLVTGLGNIGEKYLFTRHNAGFMVVDKWALSKDISFKEEKKLKCSIAKFRYNNDDIMLIKPATYMNLSGEAVAAVMNYYKINLEDLIVVYDDLSLDLGKIRFRSDGSDGGHNGIKSVIHHLNTSKIARLKIGIGPQPDIASEAFVLQNFSSSQTDELKSVLTLAVESLQYYFDNGMQKTQNKYN